MGTADRSAGQFDALTVRTRRGHLRTAGPDRPDDPGRPGRGHLACPDGPHLGELGDLHLADVRAYREQLLAAAGVEALFPLWGRPTAQLAHDALAAGLRAVVCALDPTRVPSELIGARYDQVFLDALPADVDRCGENGEFHTVVLDAPGFRRSVQVDIGPSGGRDGLVVAALTVA